MDDNWDKGFINWSEYAENSKDLIGPFTPSPSSFNPSNSGIIEIELSAEDEERIQRAAYAYEKTNGFSPEKRLKFFTGLISMILESIKENIMRFGKH